MSAARYPPAQAVANGWIAGWALLVLAMCDNGPRASKDASAPSAMQPVATDVASAPAIAAPPTPQPRPEALPQPPPTPREEILTLQTRPGVTTSALVLRPRTPPTHTVVLLVGGSGKLGLSPRGLGANAEDNFLVRTREQLVDAGFVVVLVDAPSDRKEGLEGFRSTAEHAEDHGAVVQWLREQYAIPVWLMGTSRGAISASNAVARLGKRGPDGLVLLSPITAGRHETLAEVPFAAIAVPTLIVQHRADGCSASPPAGARALHRELRRTAVHRLLLVGKPSRKREHDPCEALTRHGYADIEREVVDALIAFVKAPA